MTEPMTDPNLVSAQLATDLADSDARIKALRRTESDLRAQLEQTVDELERTRARSTRLESAIHTLQKAGQ